MWWKKKLHQLSSPWLIDCTLDFKREEEQYIEMWLLVLLYFGATASPYNYYTIYWTLVNRNSAHQYRAQVSVHLTTSSYLWVAWIVTWILVITFEYNFAHVVGLETWRKEITVLEHKQLITQPNLSSRWLIATAIERAHKWSEQFGSNRIDFWISRLIMSSTFSKRVLNSKYE